jgi:hypothetical protein
MSAIRIGRTHRILVGIVVAGAVVIAAIGFAGSYAAVRNLAIHKGFGWFSNVFPIGVDAGIVVLLSLDLLLTWFRIPFPLLRQTAWLLTAATIAFNGAAAWPDPLGVGMHAVIPILFVVCVEAARHAIGRVADITADRHMESVRIARWLLAFPSTFRLWRRMKLWELRSYDEVIRLEQHRLVYQARLRAKYGRAWRRKAPVESLMPLRLAKYGVPLAETADAGLAAAGITVPESLAAATADGPAAALEAAPAADWPAQQGAADPAQQTVPQFPQQSGPPPVQQYAPLPRPEPEYVPPPPPVQFSEPQAEPVKVPAGPNGRSRNMTPPPPEEEAPVLPDGLELEEALSGAFHEYTQRYSEPPTARQFGHFLMDFSITNENGGPLSERYLRPRLRELIENKRLEEVS